MGGFFLGLVVGAVVFALFLRNNKKVAKAFYGAADWVEFKIEKTTGKDI